MAYNVGRGLSTATLSGVAGAKAGSIAGPWGAAAGGGLGFLGGLFAGLSDEDKQTLDRFPPEIQQQILQQYQAAAQGNPQGFQPIADEARQQFNTQGVPGLAERFTAMGGGQRSSAFAGALGSARAQLDTGLAGLKAQYGQQQMQSLLPFLEQQYEKRQPSQFENFASNALSNTGPLAQWLAMQGMSPGQQNSSGTNQNLMDMFGQKPINLPRPSAQSVLGGGNIPGSQPYKIFSGA